MGLASKNLKWAGSLVSALLIAGILLGVLIHLGDSLAWLCTAPGLDCWMGSRITARP